MPPPNSPALVAAESDLHIAAASNEPKVEAAISEMEKLEEALLEPEFIDDQVPDTVCWYVAYST